MFAKIFLILQGVGFILFGLYCFFNPQAIVDILGAPSVSSGGIYEIRGIYGGVTLGIGLLALSGGLKADMRRTALFVLMAYTGGYGLARLAALPLDGIPDGTLLAASIFEITTALVCAYLLRRKSVR